MTLKEVLEVIRSNAKEIDIKVCYNNEYGEECTLCRTFVEEKAFEEGKAYWSSKVTQFAFMMDLVDIERYADFEASFITAKGENHFFIFASNFHDEEE